MNGDSVIDFSQTTITVLNADGSRTTFVSDFFGNGALRSRTVTTTSANGLSKSTEFDLNGDGVVDEYLDDVTTFYADGWREQVTTETYADGTLKSQTFNGIDARTYNSYEITEFDTNGDEVIDRDIQVWIDQDGYRTDVITYYNADGSQKAQVQNENGPDGLSQYIWYGGVEQEGFPNESSTSFRAPMAAICGTGSRRASPRPPPTPSISVASTTGYLPTRASRPTSAIRCSRRCASILSPRRS